MAKKSKITTDAMIRARISMIFTRSRERAAAMKRAGYRCSRCGVKQSAAKGRVVRLQGHHIRPTNYKRIIKVIREELLVSPDLIEPICKTCHDAHHENEKKGKS